MRGTAIFTVPVGKTMKVPVVCYLGGIREVSLNRVEYRPGTEGFRRDRLFQVDALVSRLANVFFFSAAGSATFFLRLEPFILWASQSANSSLNGSI